MKKLLISVAGLALLASAGTAFADNNTAQLNITADVKEGCTLSFATANIAFPSLAKSSNDTQTQPSSFTVACNGAPAHVDLDMGKNADNGTERYMALTDNDGTIHKLHYTIYQGTTGNNLWSSGKDTYKVPGANTNPGTEVANNFRAVITPADVRDPNVISGHYTDTLLATVLYGN